MQDLTYGESSNGDREGGGVEEHLSVGGKEGDEFIESLLVVHGEKFVCLV